MMPRRKRPAIVARSLAPGLAPKQAQLVQVVLDAAAAGGRFPTRQQLGERAGYGSGEAARVSASRTLALDHVREAIAVGLRQMAQVDAALAYSSLRIAAGNANSARDRIAASREILHFAGMSGPAPHNGPAVAIQIVFRNRELAETLASRTGQAVQVVDAVPAVVERL
jgi:hypothetical protein